MPSTTDLRLSADLSGRVAVVTGASSGIGAATARSLAAHGAAVALLARRADKLDALASEITAAGGRALAVPTDVTDAAALAAAATRVREELGTVSILFNNAGIMLPGSSTDPELAGDRRTQIDLNIAALVASVDAFVGQLVESGRTAGVADLVNTSSIAGENIFPNFAVYSGTKAFVKHYTTTLRTELGAEHVRVGDVAPGIVGTELQSHVTDPGALEWLEGSKEQMEWLAPEDVAELVTFAVSRPARVNLQHLTVMPTRQPS